MKTVCADCGTEMIGMDPPCPKCGGPRIVTQAIAEAMFGPKWRNAFLHPDDPDHLKQSDIPKHSPVILHAPRRKLPTYKKEAPPKGELEKFFYVVVKSSGRKILAAMWSETEFITNLRKSGQDLRFSGPFKLDDPRFTILKEFGNVDPG